MNKRNCIFHIPNDINGISNSGSSVRPQKMIAAFENIGYEVEVIMGSGKTRQKQIRKIKNKIENGIVYDFLYSESSNLPTLLTEGNHIPKYPFLDFGFLKYCKENKINIGLFYRDVHWKFEHFKKGKNKYKLMVGELFYKYDLKKYSELLDVFYIPSKKMLKYIPIKFTGKIEELPPGGYKINKSFLNNDLLKGESKKLNVFYVGGLGNLYNLEILFQATVNLEFIKLTICCRENEWNNVKSIYQKYLNDRIEIIHEEGENLYSYFQQADILNLYLEPTDYWEVAIPIKLFEYISHKKPIIAVEKTAVGKYIKKQDIGWVSDYSLKDLVVLLKFIYDKLINEKEVVNQKIKNVEQTLIENTWEIRAEKVVNDLSFKQDR